MRSPGYGFNFQWMVSWRDGGIAEAADECALDFLAKWGFDFVRVPTDYRFWTRDHQYFRLDDEAMAPLDDYLVATRSRGMHLSLNVHRAPGYCINRNDLEIHNLWVDQVAQDAFVHLWETFARRFLGVSGDDLSFDLLNEPPEVGQYGFNRAIHERLIRRAVQAIRAIDPARPIVIDGLAGGHLAMPELGDLGVTHSGRGYQPMTVSHYGAEWWEGSKGMSEPTYPGGEWEGRAWDLDALRSFYEPWREVERQGNRVHIGEFGCYRHTPNDVAMRWFQDLFGLYREFGWGFALWNFEGHFGIIDHGRPGARFEEIDGYRVDRELFELVLASRVARASLPSP